MRKLFLGLYFGILLTACTKEKIAPKPLVADSKVSMFLNGTAWESNQPFDGYSATAYNSSSSTLLSGKWTTAFTAQNNADEYLYFTISYNAKPQVDQAYPFKLASFKQNGKEYAGGQVIGTSGTVTFTAVTDTSLSGTFSGKLALIEGVSTVVGYADITYGKFTKIKYKP